MKEIIVKNDGQDVFSLEIYEDKLRIYIGDNAMGSSEDFSIEEIDDLQEAISIMKDRLQRNLSDKDQNFNCEIVPTPDFSLLAELTGGKLIIESIKNDSDNVFIKGKLMKNDISTVDVVSNNEGKVTENADFWKKYNEISKQLALGEKVEYKIGESWYTINEIVGDLESLPLLDCRIRKNK